MADLVIKSGQVIDGTGKPAVMGDIVISKMAIRENSNGERLAHVDREAGNVSRMNYVDAIKPQDADFDFDKSFNFVAAPGLFWREANRLAGHISTESPDKTLNRLFDPNTTEGLFAKTLPEPSALVIPLQ